MRAVNPTAAATAPGMRDLVLTTGGVRVRKAAA